MPDRVGNELQPGDWVMVIIAEHDELSPEYGEVSAPATVLKVIGDNRYLVQSDPDGPPADMSGSRPAFGAYMDQVRATLDEMRSLVPDPQEPFEVDGGRLEALETEDDFDP